MKQGGPIPRKSEMKRGSGLARGGELGRGSGLSRGKPMDRGEPMRRTRMKRKPADNHLSADEWVQVFHLLLVRSGGRCEGQTPDCLAPGGSVIGMPRDRVSVQHRRAQGVGGTSTAEANTLANLLILCGSSVTGCHNWVEHAERDAAEDRGLWVRHTYRDGILVPVERYPLTLHSGRRVFLHPTEPRYVEHPDPYGIHELPAVLAG